jgi:hypothetical protein
MQITPKSRSEMAKMLDEGLDNGDEFIIQGVVGMAEDGSILTAIWDKYKDQGVPMYNWLRFYLAHNEYTPGKILAVIYTDQALDPSVRNSCLKNPSMPMQYVRDAACSPEPDIRHLAAQNEGLDEMTLLKLSQDDNNVVAHTAFETMRVKARKIKGR